MAMTAEMLLKNKGIIKERTDTKETTLKIKSLEGKIDDPTITIKSLDINEMKKIQNEAGGDEFKMAILACYNGIVEPNLKDKKLHQGYECKSEPYKIVENIFEKQEFKYIANKIGELSGLGNVKEEDIIEEIKNV